MGGGGGELVIYRFLRVWCAAVRACITCVSLQELYSSCQEFLVIAVCVCVC